MFVCVLQSFWFCDCCHVNAEHADSVSSSYSLRVCDSSESTARIGGGSTHKYFFSVHVYVCAHMCTCVFRNVSYAVLVYNYLEWRSGITVEMTSFMSSRTVVFCFRVCLIQHAMGSGLNGLHPLREADWLQQHSVVRS